MTVESEGKKKVVAIVQSCYIPWKGYFDLIGSVDEFIIYDDMQYTRRDWRNRNLIKTPQGLSWLTLPVKVKGKYHQLIRETELEGDKWRTDHWKALQQNYRRAPFFDEIAHTLEPLYLERSYENLSDLNRAMMEALCLLLGISTPMKWSWEYDLVEGKTERLVGLSKQAGATVYVSGPAAKDYIQPELFADAGIALRFFDYSGYPEYPQQWGAFEHGVTALDLLFNCGKDARNYMKYPAISQNASFWKETTAHE
ncbi:WbqC family protein [Cupriavidus pauculus]|uniref:WbqC family protein n=1 Tax=Cupriavidus pauculus TaxID=82633 RepID=A0A2N5CH41_9BURK|nr:WbqC family protein [Cupriavidus pauculus]PLQ01533.1 hypothetical protein CYJ10_07615 [Cupriavidus pauculus]